MPRIIPVQLLKCLKVLLDDNGGILSAKEVERIAGLMTKYSKKLVSKCIYVLILKSTKTELLGAFMTVGGWSLVYTWLNDGIRAMNWPLVQEILELLLLCPVDVHRLKINSAPKLVKGLCKEGGTEGVRILAKRLVDQWLKVVTDNTHIAEGDIEAAKENKSSANTVVTVQSSNCLKQDTNKQIRPTAKTKDNSDMLEKDPLDGFGQYAADSTTFMLTPAQKKANETGLVYKIIVKDGKSVLAKVNNPVKPTLLQAVSKGSTLKEQLGTTTESDAYLTKENADVHFIEEEEHEQPAQKFQTEKKNNKHEELNLTDESDGSYSRREKQRNSKEELQRKKKSSDEIKRQNSTILDNKDKKDKEKEKDRHKEKSSKSSSSSSSHKLSSSSSSALKRSTSPSSSSSSKLKTSSSNKSSSSSDKHRSSSSSSSSIRKDKDKDRHHKSSEKSRSSTTSISSKSGNSSSSSKNSKIRDKIKERASETAAITAQKKEKESAANKEKEFAAARSLAIERLGRIPKKVNKDAPAAEAEAPTSIIIPSKKASISIEIRKDSEKNATVKTYKSQFRSHGLTEEAPPPPSRKGLKKPSNSITGTSIPATLPATLKRPSPPPRETSTDIKKSKIDMTNVAGGTEKPGSIKLIPPKKIQTLVETNLFSDALMAAMGPKKNVKRKRPSGGKDVQSPPISPDGPKLAPLKFYQDTLEEKSNKDADYMLENIEESKEKNTKSVDESTLLEKDKDDTLDDDLPLKKVKEDIENKVRAAREVIDEDVIVIDSKNNDSDIAEEQIESEPKKPGPGCGPDGPPGVLMLHRRKGPKKKLSWRPQEELEQIRYFEIDETERVNVTKTPTSFLDMQNMERFKERDAINIARRGFSNEDNMEPQTTWRPLIEVDDVVAHPNGNLSKQRKIQEERELSTLRALYFSHIMIPDSPAEAELEPHYAHDVPIIPLDDVTGNPDAVNNYRNMPWPEPKGSPKQDDNVHSGTGGLVGSDELFLNGLPTGKESPFNTLPNSFGSPNLQNTPAQSQTTMPMPANPNAGAAAMNNWPMNVRPYGPNGPMMNNQYNSHMSNGPNVGGMPLQNFMGVQQFGPMNGGMPFGNNGPFGQGGFNGPNMRPMGPNGLMNGVVNPGPHMMNGPPMMVPMVNNGPGPRNNRNMPGNWQNNGNMGNNGPWRSAGTGPLRGPNNNGNNGICKAFMRGQCRLGKSCKFIHPSKHNSKRI